MQNTPKQIHGDLDVDDRGVVRFVNDFSFADITRFYQVENISNNIIRAFHGHKKEAKYVYVSSGTALINIVKLTDLIMPSQSSKIYRFILSDKKPSVLLIPPMFANGFKTLEKNTKIIFFSTSTLKQSEQSDDYRYPFDYWGKDIWQIENR